MAHAGQPGWPGRIIDGRYAVESVLGQGGMGLVLKARHQFTGADVALKVLKQDLELDQEIQLRFLAEARAPNAIGHPGIVGVLDAGKAPDGLLYLVMELLVGTPLRVPLARGELGAGDMRRILLELLDALGAAHARGFVHRDLKPENIFLAGPNKQVKLLDFGIAKVLDAGIARVRTATGATLGTPAYMAPEQFHDPSGVDARADLWAVGVMAYEMLSGRLPFRGDTIQSLLVAVATQEPDPLRAHVPNAPPALEAFFVRALARNPAQRFASTQELAAALASLPLGAPQPPPSRMPVASAHTPRPQGPVAFAHTPAPGGSAPAMSGATMATGAGASWPTPPPSGSTPGLPGATMATGAGTSLPPRIHTPSAAPPPMTGPVPMIAPQSASNKKSWVVGLSLASVVSVAIVIIAIVATRKSSDTTAPPVVAKNDPAAAKPSADTPGDDKTVAKAETDPPAANPPAANPPAANPPAANPPAANPDAPSGDDPLKKYFGSKPAAKPAATPPRGTATTPAVKTTRPARPAAGGVGFVSGDDQGSAPEGDVQAQCRTGCENAGKKCGNAAPNCVRDCVNNAPFRACLLTSPNCTAGSQCAIKALCGNGAMNGAGTCAQAAQCQKGCPYGDVQCGCGCVASMSPTHARAITALDACMLRCGGTAECATTTCQIVATSCYQQ